MSYLLASRDLLESERSERRKATLTEVGVRANIGGIPFDNQIYRDVLANLDMGLTAATGWQLQAQVAGTQLLWISNALGPKKWIGIYAINGNLAVGSVNEIRFQTGSATGGVAFLGVVHRMMMLLEQEMYLDTPLFWDEQKTAIVQVLPRLARPAGDELMLEGIVAEEAGDNVSV